MPIENGLLDNQSGITNTSSVGSVVDQNAALGAQFNNSIETEADYLRRIGYFVPAGTAQLTQPEDTTPIQAHTTLENQARLTKDLAGNPTAIRYVTGSNSGDHGDIGHADPLRRSPGTNVPRGGASSPKDAVQPTL